MISLNDVLLAMSNIPVDDPIAEIWGRGLQGGYKIIEYTGSLPITINANGDALLDYRIYGADGGVGVATENLIDANKPGAQRVELEPNIDYCLCKYTGSQQGGRPQCNVYDENDNRLFGDYLYVAVSYSFTNPSNGAYAIIFFSTDVKGKLSFTKGRAKNSASLYPANYIPYGYKLPMTVQSLNLIDASLSEQTIEIKPSTPYAVSRYENSYNAPGLNFGIYDENDNLIWSDYLGTWRGENLRVFDNAKYFKITIPNSCLNAVSLVEGIRPPGLTTKDPYPENYIPYQKITTPVYIGENQLEEDEYVSYSDGKIYRMVDGTLTPTDPPVPLPEMPTIKGETVIDYDGDPKPSQMYVKYKGKR